MILPPDMPVLPHLERIGRNLLATDNLTEADRALDGAYDLDERTLALLRTLEAACMLEGITTAAGCLREARRQLQTALVHRRAADQPRDGARQAPRT